MNAFWIAAIGFPFVAAIHGYAVSYGYRGVSKQEAWQEAKSTFFGAWIVVAFFIAAFMYGG